MPVPRQKTVPDRPYADDVSEMKPGEERRLRVLHAVYEVSGGKTSTNVDVPTVHALLGDLDIDRDSLEDELSLLMDQQLLDGFKSLGGLNDIFLKPRGKDVAMQFAAARSDARSRLRQLQDDYLRWLYDETEIHGRAPTPDDYLATAPAFLGVLYTPAELEKAGERLAQEAFISGPSAWQYAGPIRPKLSAKGRLVVESERSVHDALTASPAVQNNYTTTVHGPANVANASPGTKQNLVVEAWGPRVTATLDALDQSLVALPEDVRTALAPLISDARKGVESDEPSRTRRALQAVGGFLSDTTTGALGGVLGAQVLALIPLLGG